MSDTQAAGLFFQKYTSEAGAWQKNVSSENDEKDKHLNAGNGKPLSSSGTSPLFIITFLSVKILSSDLLGHQYSVLMGRLEDALTIRGRQRIRCSGKSDKRGSMVHMDRDTFILYHHLRE